MSPNLIWQNDKAISPSNGDHHRIDVCICAFARPDGLVRCLQSLAGQAAAPPFRVLVADNHKEPVVPQWLSTADGWPFPVRVLHAPHANISVARNACLDAASSEWIAFIDDDEIAAPGWLASLYSSASMNDVVFGPVRARYAPGTPQWLVDGDFLSKSPARRSFGLDTGHTANALLRRSCADSLYFDETLGQTGGEDSLFFASLHARGARLGFCGHALVFEPADPRRCSFSALWVRSLASGHAHARVLLMRNKGRMHISLVAGAKALACLGLTLINGRSTVGRHRQLLRFALHLGVLAHAMRWRAPLPYGGGHVTTPPAATIQQNAGTTGLPDSKDV